MAEAATLTLFVGLVVPSAIATDLAAEQHNLMTDSFPIAWAHPSGLHLTLQYLGRVDSSRVAAIDAALAVVAQPLSAFALQVTHLGAFPRLQSPRILWAGVKGDLATLHSLQQSVVAALQPLGFEPDARPFAPHITLGRVRQRTANSSTLKRIGNALAARSFEPPYPWPVTSIALVQSLPTADGRRYEAMRHYPLAEQPSPPGKQDSPR
jgi:2'-5' RNA ligase